MILTHTDVVKALMRLDFIIQQSFCNMDIVSDNPLPSIDVKTITLQQIRSLVEDPINSEYVLSCWTDIVKNGKSIRVDYCIAICELAVGLMNKKEGVEKNRYFEMILKISRSGLNAIFRNIHWTVVDLEDLDVNSLCQYALLNYYCGLGCYFSRPFHGLESLNNATKADEIAINNLNEQNYLKEEDRNKDLLNLTIDKIYHKSAKYGLLMNLAEVVNEEDRINYASAVFAEMNRIIEDFSKISLDNTDHKQINFKEHMESLKHALNTFRSENKLPGMPSLVEKNNHSESRISELDENEYKEWCWTNHLWINPLNEVSGYDEEWASDSFGDKFDKFGNLRLKDIMGAYDHCRRLLFEFSKFDKYDRRSLIQGESLEKLKDCHLRIYSIIDKAAKLIYYGVLDEEARKEITETKRKDKEKDEHHRNDFEYVCDKFAGTDNPFLKSIYYVKEDIYFYNGDNDENDRKDESYRDPFYSQHKVKFSAQRIRNNITHSATLFIKSSDNYKIDDFKGTDILVLSSQDLEMDTWKFMWQIREILLNLQLALNYQDSHTR